MRNAIRMMGGHTTDPKASSLSGAGIAARPRGRRGLSPVPGARVLAVGGGKGGVGKTFLTANLSVALARAGHRVVCVDADLEGANLHTCLGAPAPARGLADFVAGREDDLGALAVGTSIANLDLVAGTHSNVAAAQPSDTRRVALMRELRRLPAEFVLVDLGAGVHPASLDYFLVADDGILVITPEPTSIENAYNFLRAAFYRRLHLAALGHGARDLVSQAMDPRNARGIRTPFDLLREIESLDPAEGARLARTVRDFHPRIVLNGVRNADHVELGFQIRSVCRKYFGIAADYLGYVAHDEAVRRSIEMRRPLVDQRPGSDAALFIRRIARKLAARSAQDHPRGGPALRPPPPGGPAA